MCYGVGTAQKRSSLSCAALPLLKSNSFMSDILRPSASHMFCSKASSAGGDKSETFRVLKVLINLICPVKQLVAYRWTASSYIFRWSVFTGCCHVFAHPFFDHRHTIFCFVPPPTRLLHMCVIWILKVSVQDTTSNAGELWRNLVSRIWQTNLVEMWHVGLETVSHSTVTSWP